MVNEGGSWSVSENMNFELPEDTKLRTITEEHRQHFQQRRKKKDHNKNCGKDKKKCIRECKIKYDKELNFCIHITSKKRI